MTPLLLVALLPLALAAPPRTLYFTNDEAVVPLLLDSPVAFHPSTSAISHLKSTVPALYATHQFDEAVIPSQHAHDIVYFPSKARFGAETQTGLPLVRKEILAPIPVTRTVPHLSALPTTAVTLADEPAVLPAGCLSPQLLACLVG